jgi:hypothetical protein
LARTITYTQTVKETAMSVDFAATHDVSWTPYPSETGKTVTLTAISPVGGTTTPSVSEAAGVYSASLVTGQPGQYQLSWAMSDDPGLTFTDVLNVWPEHPRYLLSLADARKAATGRTAASSEDSTIQLFNASGTVVIEDVAGSVIPAPETQVTDGGRPAINLWKRLAADADVTVTVNGTALVEESDFIVDRTAMIIYAGSRTSPGRFSDGRLNVSITYTSGVVTLPPNIEQAAIELIRHQYQVGHQAVHAEWSHDPSGDDTLEATPSGFLLPRRVIQLCRATPRLPSF